MTNLALLIDISTSIKVVTFQFFIERQPVSSIDSFMKGRPSLFSIESIEPSTIISVRRDDFEKLFSDYDELKDRFHNNIFQRFNKSL